MEQVRKRSPTVNSAQSHSHAGKRGLETHDMSCRVDLHGRVTSSVSLWCFPASETVVPTKLCFDSVAHFVPHDHVMQSRCQFSLNNARVLRHRNLSLSCLGISLAQDLDLLWRIINLVSLGDCHHYFKDLYSFRFSSWVQFPNLSLLFLLLLQFFCTC